MTHCQAQSFPIVVEAQKFIDAYLPPVDLQLNECAAQDLVIFTDGSFTKAGSKPVTAAWEFVVQPGDEEEAINEGSGPLATRMPSGTTVFWSRPTKRPSCRQLT